MKPVILDLPYPSFDDLATDLQSATIISPAYAGLKGELTATLQYRFHNFYFESYGYKETSDLLTGISFAEMKHLDFRKPYFKTRLSARVYHDCAECAFIRYPRRSIR